MWTDLPREVIEIVMKDMSQDDLWTCRDISSRWAAAAKASGLLKLVTSLSPSAWTEVSVKLFSLHYLKISNSQVQCCIKVEPPDTAACAAMLKPLADQVMAAAIADCADCIQAHRPFEVCCQISLCAEVALVTVVAGHPTAKMQATGGLEIPGRLGVRLGSRHQ